ncbi:archaea-specific SMC-related protein [Halodesulfurarchaeum formicicum]|nr:archaea-specific SMC-related protein [Halodesulfurarchaeum formicicum]
MPDRADGPIEIEIRNLGGIESLSTSIPSGVTILAGANATNRTSFLRSVAAALGASDAAISLKTDAESGSVTLSFDGQKATREFSQSGGTVHRRGDPLSDAPPLVDTYVSIFATNPARSTIRNGGTGLREVLMRGVDTDAIDAEIQSLKSEQADLEAQLAEIERAQGRLPDKRERRAELADELAETEETIATVEDTIEAYRASEAEIEAAEEYLSTLEETRNKLRQVEREIEETERTRDTLVEERATLEGELESLSVSADRRADLSDRKGALESEIDALESTIAELSDIISHNQSILEDADALDVLGTDDEVVGQLDPSSSTVRCWTCGSEVDRETIESRIETMEAIRAEKNETLQEKRAERESVAEKLAAIEQNQTERERLKRELRETESAIEAEDRSLSELRDRASGLREEVSDLQEQVSETAELRDSDLPEAYERLNRLQHERGQLETRLERVESELTDLEATADQKETVSADLEQVRADLEAARGRVDRIERELIEEFNEQMADLIDLLGYENLSRVWIERLVDGQTTFEIHVVRDTVAGTVYEDTLSTLSESEREIVGIVVALSGYLVHDVKETVPLVLFDSVEAIDAERLAAMLEYVGQKVPYVLTALLPEQADAIDEQTIQAPAFEP